MVGECGDLRLLNIHECLDAVQAHADLIVGVKVRVGYTASDGIGVAPLDMAIEVADEAGIPVMPSETHIVPVPIGDPRLCKRFAV